MNGLTLDAGTLIAFERNERRTVAIVARAVERRMSLAVPAGVVGQVWRDGRRQARLARLLGSRLVTIEALDERRARAAGELLGAARTHDVVDASVVLCARARKQSVLTSDVLDLRRLDPSIHVVAI